MRIIINSSSTIFTVKAYSLHRRYNTKIHQHSFARREHKRNRKHRVDSFPAKREPRVLSERGIVQRARDNRGRPFRKFDGMRSPSAKRRHPGETFYRRCLSVVNRNTIAFHLEIRVQYPRYNFVERRIRAFGGEKEREREYKGPLLYFTALRCSTQRCREIL